MNAITVYKNTVRAERDRTKLMQEELNLLRRDISPEDTELVKKIMGNKARKSRKEAEYYDQLSEFSDLLSIVITIRPVSKDPE